MCLSKIYINDEDNKEPLMQDVVSLEVTDNGKLLVKTLFGQQEEIQAKIRKIDFLKGSILLKDSE